jgi:hypothetical protein
MLRVGEEVGVQPLAHPRDGMAGDIKLLHSLSGERMFSKQKGLPQLHSYVETILKPGLARLQPMHQKRGDEEPLE